MLKADKLKQLDLGNVFSNIGRSIVGMTFNALVFFLLNKPEHESILKDFTWFLIITSLAITITGWGLKDYQLKQFATNWGNTSSIFSSFFSAKVLLVFISSIFVFLLDFSFELRLSMILLIFLKSINSLFDPLIVFQKKITLTFFAEALIYLTAIFAFILKKELLSNILWIVIAIEFLRTIMAYVILVPAGEINFKISSPIKLLRETRFYFLIALFSLFANRLDTYVIGLCGEQNSFVNYNIIMNLVVVSFVVISAIYNYSLKAIYKLSIAKADEVLGKLIGQFILLSFAATGTIFLISKFLYAIDWPLENYVLISFNVFFYCLTIRSLYILTHSDRILVFLVSLIISTGVNLGLSVLLIPDYNSLGALIANTSGSFVLAIMARVLIRVNKIVYRED